MQTLSKTGSRMRTLERYGSPESSDHPGPSGRFFVRRRTHDDGFGRTLVEISTQDVLRLFLDVLGVILVIPYWHVSLQFPRLLKAEKFLLKGAPFKGFSRLSEGLQKIWEIQINTSGPASLRVDPFGAVFHFVPTSTLFERLECGP